MIFKCYREKRINNKPEPIGTIPVWQTSKVVEDFWEKVGYMPKHIMEKPDMQKIDFNNESNVLPSKDGDVCKQKV